jgi:hypothetical protein
VLPLNIPVGQGDCSTGVTVESDKRQYMLLILPHTRHMLIQRLKKEKYIFAGIILLVL